MPSAVSAPPSVDLSFLFNQASFALAARMGGALSDLGISVREYCVLMKAAEEERTQIAIADLAALDKTTMVVTLDGLEKAGLAERRVSPTDRRARVVHVTSRGLKLLGRAHVMVAEVYDEALADLSRSGREAFLEALATVTDGVLATPSHTSAQRRKTPPPHRN
ncbi:MAG: MarR family transcriptional regulator [Marmoricola sp.]